jgi:sugar diacid utilization regulator
MLEVTMRTAELMRKNAQLAKELAQLRQQAEAFVEDVLSNPENAHLRRMRDEGTFNVQQVSI